MMLDSGPFFKGHPCRVVSAAANSSDCTLPIEAHTTRSIFLSPQYWLPQFQQGVQFLPPDQFSTSMNMMIAYCIFFLVIISGPTCYAFQVKDASIQGEGYVVPGIDLYLNDGSFLNVKEVESSATSKKKKNIFSFIRSRSAVAEDYRITHDPRIVHNVMYSGTTAEQDYLDKILKGGSFTLRTALTRSFHNAYTSETHLATRNVIVQRLFQHLLKDTNLKKESLGEWIELFTSIIGSSGSLPEIVNTMYGLRSLRTKYFEDSWKPYSYRNCAELVIEVSKLHIRNRKFPDSEYCKPWIQEFLNPEKGISEDMRDFDKFRRLVSYEPRFHEALKNFNEHLDNYDKASPMISMFADSVFCSTRGISAQSKTASIVFLYHYTWSNDEVVADFAKKTILGLHRRAGISFDHDSRLLERICKDYHL